MEAAVYPGWSQCLRVYTNTPEDPILGLHAGIQPALIMTNYLSTLLITTQQHWLLAPAAARCSTSMASEVMPPVSQEMPISSWGLLTVEAGLLTAIAAYFALGLITLAWG